MINASDAKTIRRYVRSWLNQHVFDLGENPYQLTRDGEVWSCIDAVTVFCQTDGIDISDDVLFEETVCDEWDKWMENFQASQL